MTDRYALFGNPLGHSKSPLIHGAFARETGQDMSYELIQAPLDGFAAAVAEFHARGGRGMNVTMPFKLEAFALATELSQRARLAGAANALKVDGQRLLAENFDGVGLVNDIQRNLDYPMSGTRVLLMGAGGPREARCFRFSSSGPRGWSSRTARSPRPFRWVHSSNRWGRSKSVGTATSARVALTS
jgi:shikimate dehydrogenase